MRHYKNIELDGALVYGSMKSSFELTAMNLGLKPNEAFSRAKWLKKQPKQYVHAVTMEVKRLEKKSISDKLK